MKAVLITSSILILLIVALRPILRGKLDPRVQYALWLAVALRLLIPVNLVTSAYSALALLERAEQPPITQTIETIGQATIPIPAMSYEDAYDRALREYQQNRPDAASFTDLNEVEHRAQELQAKRPTLAELAQKLARPMWLGGTVLMGLWLLLVNLRLRWKLKSALPTEADCPLPVYVTPVLPSPCLCGTFRPAVFVTPAALTDPDRLRHVLAHELTHYRHKDHWWALVRCLCLCLYWFDPLVWWAAALSRQDCELACDEGAIRRLGEGERIPYGRTLVAMIAAGRNSLLQTATTMTGSKRRVQERIKLIARRPKTVIAAALVLVIVLGLAVGCTFIGAPTDSSTPSSDPEPASSSSINTDDVLFQNLSFFYDDYSGVVIEGLEGSHAEWHADTSPSKGWLYFTNPGFCCPALEGRKVEGSALWGDESRTTLGAVMSVNDERVVSGTVTGFYIHFTVELETGTVLTRDFASEIEGETLELDDQEMVGMAHALAKLLTAAEDYYLDNILVETDTIPQTIQAVVERLLAAPMEFTLAPVGSSQVYAYPYQPGEDSYWDAQFPSLYDEFQWEETDVPTSSDDDILRISSQDGMTALSFFRGSFLMMVEQDKEFHCYKGRSIYGGDITPYGRLRWLFDEVELVYQRTTSIPDRGQSHKEIAQEWAEKWEGAMTKTASGNQYACIYVDVRDVKADQLDWMSKEQLANLVRSHNFSFTAEDFGKTWFGFSYSVVCVPENENAENNLMAGNTEDYTGDDAPEGAQICGRVGYMELIDGNWVCEATGTGW